MNAHSLKRFNLHDLRMAKFLGIVLAMFTSLLLVGQPAASTATQGTFIANTSELQWEQWGRLS